MSLFIVVPDRHCEFGAPVAAFSDRNLASAYIDKRIRDQIEQNGFSTNGYFIFPVEIDKEENGVGEPVLLGKV